MVFSYLIVPAVCAILLVQGIRKRLIVGWIIGFVGSILGLYASATLDFPTGAAIVCVFGVLFILTPIVKNIISRILIKKI